MTPGSVPCLPSDDSPTSRPSRIAREYPSGREAAPCRPAWRERSSGDDGCGPRDGDAALRGEERPAVEPLALPIVVPVADLVDGPVVLRVRLVREPDEDVVVRRRERPEGHGGPFHGGHEAVATSSSSCSPSSMTFTVPKSWRWNGVTPSSRRA